jgi:membrane-bound inhibitor of C-type lysozyme
MNAKQFPLPALALVAATVLATATPSSDASGTVHYACADGERFSVETRNDHLRLRDGSGVFALSTAPATRGERFTDGNTVFWDLGKEAVLERHGLPAATGCKPHTASL